MAAWAEHPRRDPRACERDAILVFRVTDESSFDDQATALRPRLAVAPESEPVFVLRVAEGPDAGLQLRLDGSQASRVLVGTSEACELRLTDREVSRRHVALEVIETRMRVSDLGSTNGTWVGGIAIGEAFLHGGESLRIGGTRLDVSRQGAAEPALSAATHYGKLLGASAAMRRLYPLCERLGRATVPVLIEGETGTGKEVLAESLHEQGSRAAGPFVVFDCTAVPPSLVESELFGHEKGAFTGAIATRRGVFEQAHGGTLLIDEIGDLAPELQPKLLRALERSEVRRVGADRPIRFDVRLLCATRRDLDREVQAARFRDDLFHRLAVARIELPPLRRRSGDVAVLAAHFARAFGQKDELPRALLERWQDYAWPGNVRELRNAVARWVELGELADLGRDERRPPDAPGPSESADAIAQILGLDLPLLQARQRVIRELERRYIERVLEKHGGNVTRAAAASGIALRYFQILRAKAR
jgi:DNA-binding NtrC family response regulator